jgi:hypothetical protein
MNSGDILVLYSDGVTEAQSPNEEEFGEDRFEALLQANQDKSAQEIVKAVNNALTEWAAGVHAADDITMIVAKRLELYRGRARFYPGRIIESRPICGVIFASALGAADGSPADAPAVAESSDLEIRIRACPGATGSRCVRCPPCRLQRRPLQQCCRSPYRDGARNQRVDSGTVQDHSGARVPSFTGSTLNPDTTARENTSVKPPTRSIPFAALRPLPD